MFHCLGMHFGIIFDICTMKILVAHSPCETLFFDICIVALHDFTMWERWMTRIVLIFVATSFSIDLLWLLASLLAQLLRPFGIRFHALPIFLFFFNIRTKGCTFLRLRYQNWYLFRPIPQGMFLKIHWLTFVPFGVHVGRFRYLFGPILYLLE